MRTLVDHRLVVEARASALRFECDDCAHFDPDATPPRCAHGYPVAPHRPGPLARLEEARGSVVFCKEFELGDVSRNTCEADRVHPDRDDPR